jgi:hypothetical protein
MEAADRAAQPLRRLREDVGAGERHGGI